MSDYVKTLTANASSENSAALEPRQHGRLTAEGSSIRPAGDAVSRRVIDISNRPENLIDRVAGQVGAAKANLRAALREALADYEISKESFDLGEKAENETVLLEIDRLNALLDVQHAERARIIQKYSQRRAERTERYQADESNYKKLLASYEAQAHVLAKDITT